MSQRGRATLDLESERLNEVATRYPTAAGQYVLDNGAWFSAIPRPRGIRKRADKNCYGNAAMIAVKNPRFNYAEGFAWSPLWGAIQHAWIVDGTGVAIDLTWKEPGLAYFGVSMSPQTLTKLFGTHFGLFHDGSVPSALVKDALSSADPMHAASNEGPHASSM